MKLKIAVLMLSLASCGAALAQAKAPEPDYTLSYNIGVVTDYRYRGLSQSAVRPALQGGVDYAHKSGWYAGAWGSTIDWIKDSSIPGTAVKGPVEIDLYGGYKGSINDTFSYDVGGLQYWYATNNYKKLTGENANTFELYGAVSGGPATLKYSHSLTTLFGTPRSSGSGYLDLSLSFDLGNGLAFAPHVGWQHINNFGSYYDYSVGFSKDFGDNIVLTASVIGTNWNNHFGAPDTLPGSGSRDLGKAGLVLGLKKTF